MYELLITLVEVYLSGIFKGRLPGLSQFMAMESPLKMMKTCLLLHLESTFRS